LSTKTSNLKRSSVYDYDGLTDGIFRLLKRDVSAENSILIEKYDRIMVSLSMAKATRLLHLRTLLSLSRMLGKNWSDVTKSDVDELVYKIMKRYSSGNGQETNTSSDHKKILKIFFRWFKLGSREYNEVGDPEETKRVKTKKVKDKIIREDLITESDLTRLLYACKENQRDRAFIDCQSEAGTRPGEIINLLIKHVKFDNYGAVLHVDGKTGTRTVRLIRSAPNLSKWLDVHPFRDNPESPLWIMLEKKQLGRMLSYSAARQIIKRRADAASISKRVHMNLFRHSEATKSAMFLTEAQMRGRHGWSTSSRMPARYVHLVNADVDEAILSHYGIIKEEKTRQILPKKCNVCDNMNSPESRTCAKCSRPLDLKTATEIDEKQETLNLKVDDQTVRITRLEDAMTEIKVLLTAGRKPSKLVRLTPEIQFMV
jgi:integrase/recombinase XerD